MIYQSAARTLAIEQLSRIDPIDYASSRNHLDGAVTRLSAFLRHGVLSLADVRDSAIAKAGAADRCFKFIQELAWRDYYQRVWRLLGEDIWSDLEPYKTGHLAGDYAEDLPPDLLDAQTGIDYIDAFVGQLHTTGYLHNHARMWLAAYVVHGRRVKWQAGARWFLSHLLDGDEASNNLSWQWVASTFSHKPYIYNRENVLKYSGNRFARHQPGDCFDADYDTISRTLFRDAFEETEPPKRFDLRTQAEPQPSAAPVDPSRTLVWMHDGMMSPSHPAVALGHTHLFVWDDQRLADQKFSAGRISFQDSALCCPGVHSQCRPVAEVILAACRAKRVDSIVTGETPDPRWLDVIQQLRAAIRVEVIPDRPFVEISGTLDLTRFSRYWAKAEKSLFNRR